MPIRPALRPRHRALPVLCAAMLALAPVATRAAPAVDASEFDQLRTRWHARLTGGEALDTRDPDIARAVATLAANARRHWDAMDKRPARGALWPDLAAPANSANITNSYVRLQAMALAWSTAGSPLRGDAALAADIVAGLDWLHAHRYNATVTWYGNWWDWHIGTPLALANTMTLMHERLGAGRRAAWLAAIDRFVPDPAVRLKPDGTVLAAETGANLLDKSLAVILRGVLGQSAAKIAQGRAAIGPALLYVTEGDGFYRDGSFIQHDYVPYTGAYGPAVIDDMSRLLSLLEGSRWALADPNVANVFDWATTAYAPFIYDGAMMDAVRGRAIARHNSTDHTAGRSTIAALVRLARAGTTAYPRQGAAIAAATKGWIARDTTFGGSHAAPLAAAKTATDAFVPAPLPVDDIVAIKALMADPRVAAAAEPEGVRVFASMDRVVQRGPGFAASLALFSDRISAFEYGNGENLAGWWTGMGMLALYDADQARYLGGYWPTIDKRRLPGTTTDRSGSGVPVDWKKYPNTGGWTGGATLAGKYAVAGMAFATGGVTGSTLTGRKSWFLFGDRIVAVGSGLASTDGVPVETIVENRKLAAHGGNVLTVDGVVQRPVSGSAAPLPAVRWAHLAGNVPGSDVAWYFPDKPALESLRETRSATWRTMSASGGTNVVTNHFHSLALPHGSNPRDAGYAYVILPGRSAAQAAAYAAAPTVTVLERSASVTAVRDAALGLVGATFWADGAAVVKMDHVPYLASDRKAAVLVQEAGGMLHVAVADPTQAGTAPVTIDIARAAGEIVATSPGIAILQTRPTIRLAVDVAGAAGRSFSASFRLAPSEVR
ncbi:polysaccharide lyase 8 family protein [Pseudoduganella albidiflava]|nr:polysaccharide lyase 8 family protein [Pseudoduganella albidiflava]GGY43560.1 lyase [Pseudoduganella albidiflava]